MLKVCYNIVTDETIPPLLLWENPQMQATAKKNKLNRVFKGYHSRRSVLQSAN